MSVKTETLDGISQSAALRKLAISKVLDHIVECLAVPSGEVVGLYDELGISCHQVEQEVHRRRDQLGVQHGLEYCHLEPSTQLDAGYDCSEPQEEKETRSSDGIASLLIPSLMLYLITEDIPKGKRGRWSSGPQLEALSSEIGELWKDVEQIALRAKLTQEQREMVNVLVQMLVEQREHGEGIFSLAVAECDAGFYSSSSLPAAGSKIQTEPQDSSISMPRDDFRPSSLMSPVQQNDVGGVASPPWLDLIGKGNHSRDGDKDSFQERREQSGVASSMLSTPRGVRSSQENKTFGGQRDNMVARASEEFSNVPGPGLRRKENTPEGSLEVLRVDVENKRRAKEVNRLKDEVILIQIEANRKRKSEMVENGWTDSESRLADKYSVDAFWSETLDQRASVLEERSRVTAARNEQLQARLNALLGNAPHEGAKRDGDARLKQVEEKQHRNQPQIEIPETGGRAVATLRRERSKSMETLSTREEFVPNRSRFHSTPKEMKPVRLEAFLEGRARSLEELIAWKEKANIAGAEAAALRQSCERQKATIAELTSSREKEAEACKAAREALEKERLAHAESVKRIQDLELKVVHLSSPHQQQQPQQQQQISTGMRKMSPPSLFAQTCPNHHESRNSVSWVGSEGIEPSASWSSRGMMGPREAREREKTRNAVFALEESLNVVREELKLLKGRLSWARSRFREEERRAIGMEAAAAAARAKAQKMTEAMEAAMARAEAATARSYEADQKVLAAKGREEGRAVELEAEVFQITDELRKAQEGRAAAEKETRRLRYELEESHRRAANLDRNLTAAAINLRIAETERARTYMDLVKRLGTEEKRQLGRDDGPLGLPLGGARPPEVFTGTFEISALPPLPDSSLDGGTSPEKYRTVSASNGNYELNDLRERLAESQAQHKELVRLSRKSLTEFREHCEARIRTVVAASTLSAACCRWHGISIGRDAAVEAASQLALVKRCFHALREEALIRSRERSVRRQKRLQLLVVEGLERSGEEMLLLNIRRRAESVNGDLAGSFA